MAVAGRVLAAVVEIGFKVLDVRSGVRVDVVRDVSLMDLRLEERSFGIGAVNLLAGVLEASLLVL